MMPFLEAVALWAGYTLYAAILVLLIVCVPLALVYAAVHVLAKLIALVTRRRPR